MSVRRMELTPLWNSSKWPWRHEPWDHISRVITPCDPDGVDVWAELIDLAHISLYLVSSLTAARSQQLIQFLYWSNLMKGTLPNMVNVPTPRQLLYLLVIEWFLSAVVIMSRRWCLIISRSVRSNPSNAWCIAFFLVVCKGPWGWRKMDGFDWVGCVSWGMIGEGEGHGFDSFHFHVYQYLKNFLLVVRWLLTYCWIVISDGGGWRWSGWPLVKGLPPQGIEPWYRQYRFEREKDTKSLLALRGKVIKNNKVWKPTTCKWHDY